MAAIPYLLGASMSKLGEAYVKGKIDIEGKLGDIIQLGFTLVRHTPSDFNKLQRFEDSTGERMQLKTFTGMLGSKNLEIDEVTETKLMDAMYDERQKFPFASSFASQQNADMSRFSQENITRFGDEYGKLSDNIVNRASGFLSGPQLEVFKESQTQMQTMVKMQIEMAGKMFGTGGEQPSNP